MLLTLIENEGRGAYKQILAAAAISGAANAAVLAIVNAAAENPDRPSLVLLGMLFITAALFALSLRNCVGMVSSLAETTIRKLRIRVAAKIQRAELLQLESIGANEIHEQLANQSNEISMATWPVALSVQSAVMLLFSVFYLGYVSLTALILTVAIYGAAAVLYSLRQLAAQALLRDASATRVRLLDVLSDLLRGFKEVRFRTQRSEDVRAEFVTQAELLEQKTTQTNVLQQSNYTFMHLCHFALMGAVVFVLPRFIGADAQSVQKIIAAQLFMFGSIGGVIFGLPIYTKADLACKSILALEHRLDAMATPESSAAARGEPFRELELVDVEFARADSAGNIIFAVGPINFAVRAGEIVFLVGGNGSGKTTLLRTLTGLYAPTAGMLRVNGEPVTPGNVQTYREMIAAIFTDFHLFKKLYGLADAKADKVQALLEQLEIADKTYLSEGSWSTVELSTGQRKRVAMVVALLEDRPIYIFDEWAADQDPEFRRYFYEGLLQELKRQGKAVIAISHDDRYFHCADRVVTLEYGKVRTIEQYAPPIEQRPIPPAASS